MEKTLLCLKGTDAMIANSIGSFRRNGIPFLARRSFHERLSSRRSHHDWTTCVKLASLIGLTDEWNCLYGVFRSSDIPMVKLLSTAVVAEIEGFT